VNGELMDFTFILSTQLNTYLA